MNLTKDDHLALATKLYGYDGRYYVSVAAMLGFSLKKTGHILTEDELWDAAAAALGDNQLLDAGMPKTKGEVLVAGFCHADGGRPVEATQAGFRVGQIEKKLAIFGDRFWQDETSGQHTRPLPFTHMPLGWENAYGGPGNLHNPLGKGIAAVKLPDGRNGYPLPNLEYPNRLITFRNDTPPPASPAPQGLDWPGRMEKSGSFDRKWLATVWPGLPTDFDFSLFNLAPRDQRLGGYFKGGEELQLDRLMHDTPHLISRLPEKRVRLFAMRSTGPANGWIEAKSSCDTLWLLPEAGAGIMIWHGSWEIADDEASDVVRLMAVLEACQTHPITVAEHERRLAAADQEAEPATEASTETMGETVADSPLPGIPAGLPFGAAAAAVASGAAIFSGNPSMAVSESVEAALAAYQQRLHEQQLSFGIDPQPLASPPELEQIRVDSSLPPEEQMAQLEQKLQNHLQKMGIDPNTAPPAVDAPKVPTVAETVAAIKVLPGDNAEMIQALEELEEEKTRLQAENARSQEQIRLQQPDATTTAYSDDDHTDATSTPPEPGSDDDIGDRLAKGQGLAGMDLSNRDLRCYNLAGVDLSSANLQGSNLCGMDLSSAILYLANLSNAQLARVTLARANLHRAILTNADLSGAVLGSADLSNSQASAVKLTHAELSGADFSDATLTGADFSDCTATSVTFDGADLTDARLHGARLASANLCEIKAIRADFSRADLKNVQLGSSDLSSAIFEAARMTAASSDGGSSFIHARMSGAELDQAYFEDSDFSGAVLAGCKLRGARFVNCRLLKADLHHTDAEGAEFTKSDLGSANLGGINLMAGSLVKSSLKGADLRGANLFSTDIRECNVTGARLERANLKRTIMAVREGIL
jgi:uncharacterized protein YjbI with pentapeptide repeats